MREAEEIYAWATAGLSQILGDTAAQGYLGILYLGNPHADTDLIHNASRQNLPRLRGSPLVLDKRTLSGPCGDCRRRLCWTWTWTFTSNQQAASTSATVHHASAPHLLPLH